MNQPVPFWWPPLWWPWPPWWFPIKHAPRKPQVLLVTFRRPHWHRKVDLMTGTVSLSPLVPTDHVSSRQVVITINGKPLPPIEALDSSAQFSCAAGDQVAVVDTDINAAGSTASDQFEVTAALPLQAPTKPQVLGVTFS